MAVGLVDEQDVKEALVEHKYHVESAAEAKESADLVHLSHHLLVESEKVHVHVSDYGFQVAPELVQGHCLVVLSEADKHVAVGYPQDEGDVPAYRIYIAQLPLNQAQEEGASHDHQEGRSAVGEGASRGHQLAYHDHLEDGQLETRQNTVWVVDYVFDPGTFSVSVNCLHGAYCFDYG